jgi:hypothetical protein
MAAVSAGLLATASCGTASPPPSVAETKAAATTSAAAGRAPTCSAFSLSLVSDRGGQPSPVAAAEWFAGHGGVAGVPRSGWHERGRDESGATVRSDDMTLHVVRGPDQTWQVDSGGRC